MLPSRAVTLVALTVLGGVAAAGCGLVDAFSSAGHEPVVFTYVGDTVVSQDTTVPFSIIVAAGGVPLSNPRLAITVAPDTSNFAVSAGQDSLRTYSVGRSTLQVRLLSSIITDTLPMFEQSIRIRP